ncbi:MAG: BON domain-containing protein [Planctomycetota bacterium]|nr:BON domain-containing protein [Planctomycetota bacterium]
MIAAQLPPQLPEVGVKDATTEAGSWLSKPWASARRLMIATACLSLGATNAIAQEVATAKRDQLSDRVISLAVENELLTSEAIDSHRIDAESVSGIVTLSGKVDNVLARQRASELAQQVKGVMAVVNQIIVTPGEREDKDIAQDILQAWSAEDVTDSRQLQVEVNRGTATVSGTVDSYAEKTLAEEIAAGVAGVTGIENEVAVEYKTNRSDEEIREEAQSLLESAVELDDADVKTKVTDGDVVLTGQVGSAFAKSTVERKAWVAGVNSVDVRGVQIDFDLYDGMRRRQRLQDVTDEKIVETVELALRQDPRVLSYLDTIEVESDDGSVTLSGKVGRLRAKEAAEKVARSTIGVWRVKNNLKVRWSDEEPTSHEIIDYVQAALGRDPYVSRHGIRVHCRNAHVGLYGLVDSEFEKKAAGWIAGGQKGVVHVNNSLAVAKRWEPKSDAEIKADIDEKLEFTFFDKSNDINVTVEDGVAILQGEVDTWLAWQTAMNKSIEAGARRPHNLLKVRYHPRHGGSRIYVPR